LVAAGCTYRPAIPTETTPTVYVIGGSDGTPAERFAPAFLVRGTPADHNRIGMPIANTGTTFYTSLKPWHRHASDMRKFDRFFRFSGRLL
jgi:hypothetical protein